MLEHNLDRFMIIEEYEKGKPFFGIILKNLACSDYLDSFFIIIKDMIPLGMVEDFNNRIISLKDTLNKRDKEITFLHEIHHITLDSLADEFVKWIRVFPDISRKIIKHKTDYEAYGFPIDEWYKKLRKREHLDIEDFDINWLEIVINFGLHKITQERSALNHLAYLCREDLYTKSSYNIINHLQKHNQNLYPNLENKIQEAYASYGK